jgi:hypothetical protein
MKRSFNKNTQGLTDAERAFAKHFSTEELKLLKTLDIDKLKHIVIECDGNLIKAKRELESGTEYKKAMDVLQDLRSGFNSLKKIQDTKRMLALELLAKQGVGDIGEPDPE